MYEFQVITILFFPMEMRQLKLDSNIFWTETIESFGKFMHKQMNKEKYWCSEIVSTKD